jgi:hypothetical protein
VLSACGAVQQTLALSQPYRPPRTPADQIGGVVRRNDMIPKFVGAKRSASCDTVPKLLYA